MAWLLALDFVLVFSVSLVLAQDGVWDKYTFFWQKTKTYTGYTRYQAQSPPVSNKKFSLDQLRILLMILFNIILCRSTGIRHIAQ